MLNGKEIISATLKLGMQARQVINDGWENVFTGLGIAGVDKRTGGQVRYRRSAQISLENLHDADDIAHRVVNLLPDEGTLQWTEHTIPGAGKEALKKGITDYETRLHVIEKFNKAWKWARLYGGSAIYVSIDDGLTPDQPVNMDRIYSIRSLQVLHRFEVQSQRLNDNIDSENFGMPEFYAVNPRFGQQIAYVHHSRLIRFEGAELSEQQFKNNDYWNDSVLTKLFEILRDYNNAYGSAAHVVQEFNIRIMKLKNLADIIGGDNADLLTQRMKIMNLSKSILGVLLLDSENESCENMSTPLTGLDKTLEKLDQRLVMATGMPHTVILGDGAAGTLSGKGESEEKIWKGLVAKEQGKVIARPYDRFCQFMFADRKGPSSGQPVKDHSWIFCPLWQPSEKEVAEVRKLVAETDKIYIGEQVLNPIDVAKSRFGGDEYSMETKVDLSALEAQIETDKINAEETDRLMKESMEIDNQNKKTGTEE